MTFDNHKANVYDERLQSDFARYVFSRQKELIIDLVVPHAGERMLDVGCRAGNHLQIFKEKWCSVTGIDSSEHMLNKAKNKFEDGAELILGQPEDLPFSDDEFDVVTLINILETAENPRKVIAEAIRVCRNRVFIGFVNNLSCAGTKQKLKEIFNLPRYTQVRFLRLNEIKYIVQSLIGNTEIKWGSVIYFPSFVYGFFEELEEMLPLENNPMGAFTGLVFPIKYTYRSVQHPVMESFKLNRKTQKAAAGTANNMLQETHK